MGLSCVVQYTRRPTGASQMRTRRAEVKRQPPRPQRFQVQVSHVPDGTDGERHLGPHALTEKTKQKND